jgi:hypothetical protein
VEAVRVADRVINHFFERSATPVVAVVALENMVLRAPTRVLVILTRQVAIEILPPFQVSQDGGIRGIPIDAVGVQADPSYLIKTLVDRRIVVHHGHSEIFCNRNPLVAGNGRNLGFNGLLHIRENRDSEDQHGFGQRNHLLSNSDRGRTTGLADPFR